MWNGFYNVYIISYTAYLIQHYAIGEKAYLQA